MEEPSEPSRAPRRAPEDLPRVHSTLHPIRPTSSPHASSDPAHPSTSGLHPSLPTPPPPPTQPHNSPSPPTMTNEDGEKDRRGKENDASIADWISGGPIGSKGAVLIFRSCVLASRTPSMEMESTTKSVGNNTGTSILLSKAKNMARRLAVEPHPHAFMNVRPRSIMHDVIETFGNTNKLHGNAYVVRHVSTTDTAEAVTDEEVGHEAVPAPGCTEHTRDIDDVLQDLDKITLKKPHLNVENTTANIKPVDELPPTTTKAIDSDKRIKKSKSKRLKSLALKRASSPNPDSDDSAQMLLKDVESVKVLESDNMPARILNITYKLVNTETKLLQRLLQAHGLQEAAPESKDFNLLWSGLHAKPDVLRSLSPYQRVNHFPRPQARLLQALLAAHGLRPEPEASETSGAGPAVPCPAHWTLLWSLGPLVPLDTLQALLPHQRVNHFPRSYELTRKDKLFKNIEKMQYFRGLKHFDFIPTTFLMPAEYKELCTTHYRTKGPWIVKPAASSRGRGIYIVNTPEQIPKGDNVVVAKYIDKPLLVGGHKCDLRLYVCVTSIDPLLIYLYEEGLVRFATVKYDKTNKNLWNPCMHLCNYSINKYHTDYIKCDDPNAGNIGHKWTLSALLRHLRKQGRNTSALMAAIEDLVVKSVLSSAQTIAAASRVFVPNFFNCFELFGYDILIDEMLKPWLLEINLSPSLACDSPLDARVKSALIADTLTLVGLPAVPLGKPDLSQHTTSLKMRIGACRRVHSAENDVCIRKEKAVSLSPGSSGGVGTGPLTGEEGRLVRAVKAQFSRRGGYVRIFPAQNSWQKYAQYLDPVTGIPVCSTSLNNNAPLTVVLHNYNLLVHSHVLPHFQHAAAATANAAGRVEPQRLKRYEAVSVTSAAPAISLGEPAVAVHHDARRAKETVKRQLSDGLRLTMGEGRRAFGLFLTHALKRISSPCNELAVAHALLVLKFLKRAATTLRMPYNVKGPAAKMCDKDRCAVIAKQLNDFLYMYYRETDLYTDSEDRDGCVSNIIFAQFLYSASEADLEDVLLLFLKTENYVATFLGDTRNPYCVDLPPAKLCEPPARHTLLRHLANLAPVNTRRYRLGDTWTPLTVESATTPPAAEEPPPPPLASSDIVLKDSMRAEKPLTQALKTPLTVESATTPPAAEEPPPPPLASSDIVLKDSMRAEKPLTQALKYARS